MRLAGLRPAAARARIAFPDGPVVACRFALVFADWLGVIVDPVLSARQGSPLTAVRTGSGHECRTRNRQAAGKLSAHAQGLAVDVAGFAFASGPAIALGAADVGLAAIRTAACGWFTTVLGPGSDPFHADHLHLDIQLHGSSDRYRICQ